MKNKQSIARWLTLLALSTFTTFYVAQPATAFAQGTAFSYQGRLNATGQPANGSYDLTFGLFSASSGGSQVANTLTNTATTVSNGLFTVTLDYGSGVFTGPNLWLEIAARTNGAASFTTLAPRQPILPMPYAVMANTASNLLGTLPAAQLSAGTANISISGNAATATTATTATSATSATTANNFSGSLAGNVTGTQGATVVSTVGGQTAANVAAGANAANAATSANTASIIVKRDSSGNFSAGTISAISFSGNGAGLTSLNASQLTSIGNTNSGSHNFFVGTSGNSTTSGSDNTAIGNYALLENTSGSFNTAAGAFALPSITNGSFNTANGFQTLNSLTNGSDNTAIGGSALRYNMNGSENTAIGSEALYQLSGGSGNIAVGYEAGYSSLTGNNNIFIGNGGYPFENNTIRIGSSQTATFIAGIYGVTLSPSGGAVYVNANGQLGTVNSSRRFKEAIKNMGDQSDVLLSLRPVAFRYKPDLDPQGTPQFGLIAEEVENVAPELVLRDAKGEVSSVRYEQVNAMLLNEFLKEHHKVQDLEQRLEKLEQLLNAKNGGGQ